MSESGRVPIIKLHGNLIVPIQVAMSDRVVLRLKEDVAQKIQHTGAQGLIIDVSGVDVLDSYISRSLHDIGLMAQLMGVQTVITGIDPMMAMTLVEMGLDLRGVATELDLESALEFLESQIDETEDQGREAGESVVDGE
jgi:rsbT antagonist protein RsbS